MERDQFGQRTTVSPGRTGGVLAQGSIQGLRATTCSKEEYNAPMATASYLDRLLEPLTDAFTPQMASVLLDLRADPEVEAHIGELRRKANDGTLTPAEDAEYKDFVEAVDLISIMQAKARRFLAKQSA